MRQISMKRVIRPLSEEFLYASPESVLECFYRCGRKHHEPSPLRENERKREEKSI